MQWDELNHALRMPLLGAAVYVSLHEILAYRSGRERARALLAAYTLVAAGVLAARFAVTAAPTDAGAAIARRIELTLALGLVPAGLVCALAFAGRHASIAARALIVSSMGLMAAPWLDGYVLPSPTGCAGLWLLLPYWVGVGVVVARWLRTAPTTLDRQRRDQRAFGLASVAVLVPCAFNDALLDLGWVDTVALFEVSFGVQLGAFTWLSVRRSSRAVTNLEQTVATKQRQLVHADRLAAVGTLTAGIAHEINNPLSFVLGNVSYVRERLSSGRSSPSESLHDALSSAEVGAERIRDIVLGVRELSRADSDDRDAVDVREPLRQALLLSAAELRRHAEVDTELADVPQVLASRGRLSQVFLNLLINAGQAIELAAPGEHRVTVTTRSEGAHVVIEVVDTGPGIPPEVLEQVFDPFFTTKEAGNGLGLAISRDIVESHGGRIEIAADAAGTRVRVVLPAIARGECVHGNAHDISWQAATSREKVAG